MREGQRAGHGAADLGGPLRFERALGSQYLPERSPRNQLHVDVVEVAVGTGVEDGDDAGVAEARRRSGLPAEPGHQGLVVGGAWTQDLHRDVPAQDVVGCPVHRGHPARTEGLVDGVPAGDGGVLELHGTSLTRSA